MDDLSRAFAAEIRAERTAQKLTQVELAKRARLGESTVKRIESESRPADTQQLWKLCRALGITVTELAMRAERRLSTEQRQPRRQQASGG